MTGKQLLDDCFLHDKDRLRHHEALENEAIYSSAVPEPDVALARNYTESF